MSVLTVSGVSKTYATGFQALKNVDLEIRRGEIFALLGPNGAGKTTLIGAVCGLVNPSGGSARCLTMPLDIGRPSAGNAPPPPMGAGGRR